MSTILKIYNPDAHSLYREVVLNSSQRAVIWSFGGRGYYIYNEKSMKEKV